MKMYRQNIPSGVFWRSTKTENWIGRLCRFLKSRRANARLFRLRYRFRLWSCLLWSWSCLKRLLEIGKNDDFSPVWVLARRSAPAGWRSLPNAPVVGYLRAVLFALAQAGPPSGWIIWISSYLFLAYFCCGGGACLTGSGCWLHCCICETGALSQETGSAGSAAHWLASTLCCFFGCCWTSWTCGWLQLSSWSQALLWDWLVWLCHCSTFPGIGAPIFGESLQSGSSCCCCCCCCDLWLYLSEESGSFHPSRVNSLLLQL